MTAKKIHKTQEGRAVYSGAVNPTRTDASDSSRRILDIESDQLKTRLREIMGSESNSSFGRKCGLSESLIRKYLNGTLPSSKNAAKIADACGVTVDWLATGKGNKYFDTFKKSVARAKNNQNQELIEEAQWIITKEALKSIGQHWFVMLPGGHNDPIEPFANAYNAKEILPDRGGLLKQIQSVTADDVRQWGRTYFAWKSRIKTAPDQETLNPARLRMAITLTEDSAAVQQLTLEQRADMILSFYQRLSKTEEK
jgi:transcriptional regulator with XRE-family HTH domain